MYTIPSPPPPHTHTNVSESFLQGGCVQLPQLSSWPGQGLCHDSQQVPTGSTIGPVPWIQWREIHTSWWDYWTVFRTAMRHVMCTFLIEQCAFIMNLLIIVISLSNISANLIARVHYRMNNELLATRIMRMFPSRLFLCCLLGSASLVYGQQALSELI